MIITKARNRHGTVYPYFVCLGRHQKRTDCTFRAVLIETVEERVIEHYGTVQVTAKLRNAIELTLREEFAVFRHEIESERKALEKARKRLLAERTKLLHAHYGDAVPLDLLRSEQARISEQLAYIEQRLGATEEQEAIIDFNLRRTLGLATDVRQVYRESDAAHRRLLNQAFFKRLIVHDDHRVESELAEPYDILLNPTLRVRAEQAVLAHEAPETDWTPWEASFNENTHEAVRLVGAIPPGRPGRRQGLNKEILVGAGGFEPPLPAKPGAKRAGSQRGPRRRR
jgi:site-specific DNA recombinase